MADSPPRDQVFISYSHKDKNLFDKLQTALKPLVRGRKISVWDDTKIRPGDRWREEIGQAVASAKVAVLLVSPDFLASDFIAKHELPPLLEAAEKDGLTILWIALRHSVYAETEIGRYQAVNDPTRPLASISAANREKELVKICGEIKAAATLSTGKVPPGSPAASAGDAAPRPTTQPPAVVSYPDAVASPAGVMRDDALKRYLFASYIALLVASAAGGSKIMTLGIGHLKAGVTVVSFAPTFLLTDCINQIYGREEAQKFVWPGFWALLLGTALMRLFVELPPDSMYPYPWEYSVILKPPFRIFCAGLAAYLVSQTANVIVFDRIKQKVGYEARWKSNIFSTLFSQLIDTLIFVPGAFLWADLGNDHRATLEDLKWIAVGQFLIKGLAAIVFSYPVFMFITRQSRKATLSPSG